MKVLIDSDLKNRWPEITFGVIQCEGVGTARETTALWYDLSVFAEKLAQRIGSVEAIGVRPAIAATKKCLSGIWEGPFALSWFGGGVDATSGSAETSLSCEHDRRSQ